MKQTTLFLSLSLCLSVSVSVSLCLCLSVCLCLSLCLSVCLSLNAGQRRKPISTNSPDPLRFSDVFVLTRSSDLQDDVIDDANTVTSPASGVVLGLRDAGVPVCVLEYSPGSGSNDRARWERDVVDTAVAGTDRVTVAHWRPVLGLERKVVVWLRGRTEGDDDDRSEEEVEAWDRVWVVSRCTTQLVTVDVLRSSS